MNGNDIVTSVYAADVSVLDDPALFSQAYAAVSDERRQKTDRLRLRMDKMLSLGAELLLKYALESSGVDGTIGEYRYGSSGKPYFRGDGKAFFNLSHSGTYVMCVLADSEAGCDIERIKERKLTAARRFFHPDEYAEILACPAEERVGMFYRFWTLKESYIKASGEGMKLPLNSFRIMTDGTDIRAIREGTAEKYGFREYDCIDGYRCAVCVKDGRCECELVSADIAAYLSTLK